jgi:hypothetical protein
LFAELFLDRWPSKPLANVISGGDVNVSSV